jgi:hypothetical protein
VLISLCFLQQGLESLISAPSTQLSLVSEGAECILISKRLFLKEANVKVLRIVTDLVSGYGNTVKHAYDEHTYNNISILLQNYIPSMRKKPENFYWIQLSLLIELCFLLALEARCYRSLEH